MNFGTWNVQGISSKTNEVIYELQRLEIQVAVATETKKKGQGSENLGYYDHFYSGVSRDKRAQQGVSILIAKKLRKFITSWEAISERIIKMNVTMRGLKLTIFGVYAINDDAPVNKRDEFFEQLHRGISSIGNTREVIILGDLNGRTGSKLGDKVVGRFGENVTNDNGLRLIQLCEQNELRITNGFFQHPMIHKYTWEQKTRNLRSIIDYMIVQQNTSLKIHDVRVLRSATCGSDHNLLKARILLLPKSNREQRQEPRQEQNQDTQIRQPRYNLESFEIESTKDLYKKRLDQKLQRQHFTNNTEHYEYIKQCLKEAAKEAIGYRKDRKPNKPYWWDEGIKEDIEDKRQKYQLYLSSKSNHDKTAFKEAQAQVRRKITQKKNESWERSCNKINTYLGGTKSNESWKLLKSLRQNNKRELISPVTTDKWDEYFGKLLREDRVQFLEDDSPNRVHVSASPIRIRTKEVKDVCTTLKNRKAPGPGDIPAELIKYGTQKLYEHLAELFQRCINGGDIPEEWKLSFLTPIHKKGNKENCDNYRGIVVTTSISKIYGKILNKRIEQEYTDSEAEEQAGFRAGRSTVDHLFCVTQLIEKMSAFNKEIHLLFVDLKKAYDSIPLTRLWEALDRTNLSINIIRSIKELYSNCRIKVKTGSKMSFGFTPTKGLKQGCCLSPTLFKIYLEQTLRIWKQKCENMGIPLNNTNIYSLSFADDQVIMAQDYDDIEYMTRKLIEEYKKWGLEVNISKTEYMCIGGTQQNLLLEDGQIIRSCENYKYLGMHISNSGTLDYAIKERNTQGRKAIAMLNSILWDQKITRRNKHLIYNTIIKSIVTYSCEVWQLKERTIRTLEATEMDFWRRAAGRSRIERIPNDTIRTNMEVGHTITDEIRTKQLRWYGHVQRMEERRLPKQILTWRPTGRRKRGRPRRSWREGIDNEIQLRGLDEELWNDREQWRLGIGRRRRTL